MPNPQNPSANAGSDELSPYSPITPPPCALYPIRPRYPVAKPGPEPYTGPMFFVYQLESVPYPEERYVGRAENVDLRLDAPKPSQLPLLPHPTKNGPWRLINAFSFSSRDAAQSFEAHLKSDPVNAFPIEKLWSAPSLSRTKDSSAASAPPAASSTEEMPDDPPAQALARVPLRSGMDGRLDG